MILEWISLMNSSTLIIRHLLKQGRIYGNPVADGWEGAVMQIPLGIQKCDGQTDIPTYRPTDTTRCRVTCPQLKIIRFFQVWRVVLSLANTTNDIWGQKVNLFRRCTLQKHMFLFMFLYIYGKSLCSLGLKTHLIMKYTLFFIKTSRFLLRLGCP